MSSISTDLFGSPGLVSVEHQVKGLIAAAEANIERLTIQIRELTLRRERERSILASLRLMVIPIGKLPTELLVEILELVVGSPFDPRHYYKDEARGALRRVLCLSHVSPYWRQIVHNAPRLWARSFIEICVDRESKDHYLDGLETFLARSNQLPISVALVLGGKNSDYAESPKTMARVVASTAHRWKRLDIEMPSFRSFNKIPSETFEALEHLSVDGFEKQTDPVVAFQSSPRLQNFTFFARKVSKIHLFRLPWSQLVHLDVNDPSLSRCRAILLQCSQLVSANFTTSCVWKSASGATGSPIVTLPFLDRLALAFHGVATPNQIHGIEAFLMPLALPSLKTFELDFQDDEAAFWPTQTVTSFQGRCPNIDKITLYSSSLSSEELITLLRNGLALATLEVTDCRNCINDDFWDALEYRAADASPLAPKLKDLGLEYVGDSFEDGAMEAAIRSRWWPNDGMSDGASPGISRLERAWVSPSGGDEPFGEAVQARMQDMVVQGLDLNLA
ncbi:hypothetical protein C8R45DRAFT_975389 [Mycena sanguinolenta]|nr:hypothetical protein C8R45DRAFT_975389 [Mycena sanguinolenta]